MIKNKIQVVLFIGFCFFMPVIKSSSNEKKFNYYSKVKLDYYSETTKKIPVRFIGGCILTGIYIGALVLTNGSEESESNIAKNIGSTICKELKNTIFNSGTLCSK